MLLLLISKERLQLKNILFQNIDVSQRARNFTLVETAHVLKNF